MAVNWRSPRVFLPAAALLAISLGGLGALFWANPTPTAEVEATRVAERELAGRLKAACASDATYDRLKQVAFDEAIRRGNVDPANLDLLSTYSLVRVEEPVVKSRDETLDVTLCSGRFILDLPPGAERAFGGERRLVANIEYAAQAAADGSGLVYQMEGAEPIIASLAAFDLKAEGLTPVTRPLVEPIPEPRAAPVAVASAAPADLRPDRVPDPEPRPTAPSPARSTPAAAPAARSTPAVAAPQPRPAASAPVRQAARTAPSFNCRYGRSRSEQMVCGSDQLAALDRQMSSQFYSALDSQDAQVRAELRRSRDRFLAFREGCDSEACVAQAYRDRMDEIDDIAAGR